MRSTGKSEIVDAEAAGGPPDENESQQQPSGSNTNTNILRTATLAVKKTVGTVATVTAATCNTVTDGIVLRKRYRPVSKTQTDTIENNNNSSTIGSSDETIMTMNTEKGDVAVATLRTGDAIMKSDRRFSSLLLSSSGDSFAETFETKTVASSSSTETPFSLKSVVTIGPFLEFLTADATLFFVFAFSASLYPTFEHWSLIWNSDNGLFLRTAPMATIVLSWVFAAFACGVAVGQYFDSHWLLSVINPFQVADLDSNISTNQRPYGTERIVREENEAEDMQQVKQSKHILFLGLMGKNRSSKVMFRRSKVPHIPKMEEVTSKAWSMLNNGNSSRKINRQARLSWQLDVDPTKDANSFLARTVLKRFHLRKQVASSFKTIATEHIEEATKPEEDIRDSQIGAFDLASTTADSLKDFVIEPVFKLRGMDVFLSEEPESVVSSHPWLLKQGLRETPGFTVNTLTQWGNILVYFEVPHAIFHDPEKETDMDDVKAAKRFVRGTPEYRNARMKMIPSVVEGPLPIRIVAPPKKEMVVNCDVLPISWVITEEEIVNGKKLCAHLEATLDCITSMPIRSMACLVKRYLNRLAIDLAVVVAKPEKQKEEEPSACLGLWRFNHIDVSMCPQMPSRFESSESSDVMRVSKAMGLTTDELNSLREEVNESDSCGEKKLTI